MNWVAFHSDVDDYVEFRVLMLLANRADPDGTGAWPTQEELSDATRRSARTIRRALKSLKESGRIRLGDQSRVPGTGNQKPRAYDIVMSETAESGPENTDSGWTSDGQSGWTHDDRSDISGRSPDDQSDRTTVGQSDRTSDVHKTTHSTTLRTTQNVESYVTNDSAAPELGTVTELRPNPEPTNPGEGSGELADTIPIDRGRTRSRVPRDLPDDWRPNSSHTALIRGYGISDTQAQLELVKFRSHANAHGWRRNDWDDAFTNWLAKAVEYRKAAGDGMPPRPSWWQTD